jgi:hypothetical protein
MPARRGARASTAFVARAQLRVTLVARRALPIPSAASTSGVERRSNTTCGGGLVIERAADVFLVFLGLLALACAADFIRWGKTLLEKPWSGGH